MTTHEWQREQERMSDLYAVNWRSKLTGATGQGVPISKEAAQAWVDRQNVAYPDIHHWIERASTDPAATTSGEDGIEPSSA